MHKPGTVVIAGKEYLTFPDGLAKELHKSPRTARRWVEKRIGPPVIQIGNFQIVDPDDLPVWLESRKRASLRGEAA